MEETGDNLLDLVAELRDLHNIIIESLTKRCDVRDMLAYQDDLLGRLQATAKVVTLRRPSQ